jgi:hypothetical protein
MQAISQSAQDALREAAALLRAAADTDADIDNGARLRCLSAAGHIAPDGPAALVGADRDPTDVDALVRDALQILAALPAPEFGQPHILDAAADARRALLLLG